MGSSLQRFFFQWTKNGEFGTKEFVLYGATSVFREVPVVRGLTALYTYRSQYWNQHNCTKPCLLYWHSQTYNITIQNIEQIKTGFDPIYIYLQICDYYIRNIGTSAVSRRWFIDCVVIWCHLRSAHSFMYIGYSLHLPN